MLPRIEFNKKLKRIVKEENEWMIKRKEN
jgi:hypothetical protein